MIFNKEDNRLDIVETFFISKKFGVKEDLDELNNIAYGDGFLYTPKKIYLVQPDESKTKSEMVIEESKISTPTLISNSFIIRRKVEEGLMSRNSIAESPSNYNSKDTLQLRPPIDSHKITQVSSNDFELEYFLRNSEERIVRVVPDYSTFEIAIKIFNFTNFEPIHEITWLAEFVDDKMKDQIINDFKNVKGEDFRPFEVIASKNGNYLCFIIELQDECIYQTVELNYKLSKEDE